MLRGFIKGVRGGCFVIANKWRYPQSAFTHNPGPMDINTYHLKSSIFVQFSSFQFSINWSSSEIWQEDVLEKYLKFIATAIIWKCNFRPTKVCLLLVSLHCWGGSLRTWRCRTSCRPNFNKREANARVGMTRAGALV